MALINFQKQFANNVEAGIKRQTFRKKRKYPIKINETLYLYTGCRTKKARKLGEFTCMNIKNAEIHWNGVYINETYLSSWESEKIARADGFNDFSEMKNWFKKIHGLPFEGILIKW